MKKIILSAVMVFLTIPFASAQDGLKDMWFAGGAVSIFHSDENLDSYNIMPMVGKFVSPTVAVGGAVGYLWSEGSTITKLTQFTVQPFVRKYWPVAAKLYFFGEAALPVSFGTTKYDIPKQSPQGYDKVKAMNIGVQFSCGFDLIVNKWLSVEASFGLANAGYLSQKFNTEEFKFNPSAKSKSESWSIQGNTAGRNFGDLNIGVKFLF